MPDQITIYELEEAFTTLCADKDPLAGILVCMFRERGCLIDRCCPRGRFVLDYSDLNPLRGVLHIDEDLMRVDTNEET